MHLLQGLRHGGGGERARNDKHCPYILRYQFFIMKIVKIFARISKFLDAWESSTAPWKSAGVFLGGEGGGAPKC